MSSFIFCCSSCNKLWRSKSDLNVLSTKTVKPEPCWERAGGSIWKGELICFSYFSYFNMIATIVCASGNVLKPRRSALNVFLSHPSPAMSAFQHHSELGVPEGLSVLTIYLAKTISTHSSRAYHTSRLDERMESAQIFYQHGRSGWATSPLVYEETVKITAKWKRQKAPSGTSRP